MPRKITYVLAGLIFALIFVTQNAYLAKWLFITFSGSESDRAVILSNVELDISKPWYFKEKVNEDSAILFRAVVKNYYIWSDVEYISVLLVSFSDERLSGGCTLEVEGKKRITRSIFEKVKNGKYYYFDKDECIFFVSAKPVSRENLQSLTESVNAH